MPSVTTTSERLCIACNYSLRGLPGNVCPECGRGFDPADPKTFNSGKAIGTVGRFLLRPIGWWMLLLALASTATLAFVSRPPIGRWRFSFVDVDYYHQCLWPFSSIDLKMLTPIDRIYIGALGGWAVIGSVWVARLILYVLSLLHRHIPRDLRRPGWGKQILMAILVTASLGMITLCWPYRLAQHWVNYAQRLHPPRPLSPLAASAFPGALSPQNELVVLEAGVRQLSTPEQRREAGDLLLWRDLWGDECERILRAAIDAGIDREANTALLETILESRQGLKDFRRKRLPTTLYAVPRDGS